MDEMTKLYDCFTRFKLYSFAKNISELKRTWRALAPHQEITAFPTMRRQQFFIIHDDRAREEFFIKVNERIIKQEPRDFSRGSFGLYQQTRIIKSLATRRHRRAGGADHIVGCIPELNKDAIHSRVK